MKALTRSWPYSHPALRLSSFQNCMEIHFYYLNNSVYGIVLGQSKLTYHLTQIKNQSPSKSQRGPFWSIMAPTPKLWHNFLWFSPSLKQASEAPLAYMQFWELVRHALTFQFLFFLCLEHHFPKYTYLSLPHANVTVSVEPFHDKFCHLHLTHIPHSPSFVLTTSTLYIVPIELYCLSLPH